MIKKISKFHFKSQSGMIMAKMHQLKLFLCSFYRPSLQDQRISLPQWRLYSCSLCLWHRKRLPRRFRWDWLSVRWETMGPIELGFIGVYVPNWNLFLVLTQQDCQENDDTNIANVGARTTIICQNEKDNGKKQNDLTTTATLTPSTSTSPQSSGM